ncbi:MAG: trifunctional transcriptional regulator/proline dehydrogenase/L-glutamate gamma-semialdehyde dehydrogenase, partial [Pseudomonadota bacterium]|nr:trifunctional transcriptional regulator/proline dehydrogenase/L-glutamate gamma-semialdehyde dehydrogenase [Pseudomonadota bacterium]
MLPRETVLGLAGNDADRLLQLAGVLAVGSRMLWPATAASLLRQLPPEVQERVAVADDWRHEAVVFDAVVHSGNATSLLATLQALAERPGPIVGVTALPTGASDVPLERLVVERSLSVNTAAAGGNASLMTLG